jgi:hypothetical protein
VSPKERLQRSERLGLGCVPGRVKTVKEVGKPQGEWHPCEETLWWREPISETRDGVLHLCGEPVA